ncbi:MAG: nucleotidyltransferase family protein [Alphaproteobacteria bacterium]|nr:nucleotidyltransferase family protein [Alphaproteobacteria bacterium]
MIMAAGLGTRMRPLTDDRPKPLVTVLGKPLIDHALDRLAAAGVTQVVVNVHYRADMLREHLARRPGMDIHISDESGELLGTGGGVVRALPHFDGQPFFIVNSDSVWTDDNALSRMQQQWNGADMDGLLLLAQMSRAMGYDGAGDFALDGQGHIARPAGPKPFAYPGVQIVHPRLFDGAPSGEFSTNMMWDRAIAAGRLFGTVMDGMWLHVGTPAARDEAERYLAALA